MAKNHHCFKPPCFNLLRGENQEVAVSQLMVRWESDFIIHSNSKFFLFVILCLLLKIHSFQKEHTVTLALQKPAFKYLMHFIRARSSIFLWKWWMLRTQFSEERWGMITPLFGFQENSIRHHESYQRIITHESKCMNIRFNNQLRA